MVKDKKASEFATRDYTIHLSKRLYGVTFKKRAPRAVREVKKFAQQMMKTRCVLCLGGSSLVWCLVFGGADGDSKHVMLRSCAVSVTICLVVGCKVGVLTVSLRCGCVAL